MGKRQLGSVGKVVPAALFAAVFASSLFAAALPSSAFAEGLQDGGEEPAAAVLEAALSEPLSGGSEDEAAVVTSTAEGGVSQSEDSEDESDVAAGESAAAVSSDESSEAAQSGADGLAGGESAGEGAASLTGDASSAANEPVEPDATSGGDAAALVAEAEGSGTGSDSGAFSDSDSDLAEDGPVMIDDGTYVLLVGGTSGKALDVASGSTSSGANVQAYASNGTDAQRWYVEFDRDETSSGYGLCTIKNLGSGLALDVDSGKSADGQNVQQYTANGTLAQSWRLVKSLSDDGTLLGYTILSALSGDARALDLSGNNLSNGGNVQIWTANGTAAQVWLFLDSASVAGPCTEVTALAVEHQEDLPDGVYVVSSSGALRRVADVASGSSSNGANVRLWDYNVTSAQSWKVSTVHDVAGTSWKVIANVGSGKVLDVASGATSSGTNVQQYAYNGTKAQRWAAVKNSDGTYTLWSALGSSLVLDVASGSTDCGANLQIWTQNGTAAQSFTLTSASVEAPQSSQTVEGGLYSLYVASTTKVMDVASGSASNGAQVQSYAYNGTLAQGWQIAWDEASGYYKIYAVCSNKALDLDSGDLLPGGKVQQWQATGGKAQLWAIQEVGEGLYRIVNRASGLALGVSSSSKITTVELSEAATWSLTSYTPLLTEGYYTLASNADSSQVVDVPSGSCSSGLALATYSSNGTLAQKWYIRRADDGTYTIQNVGSGLYVSESGEAVVQASRSSSSVWVLGFSHAQGLTLTSSLDGLLLACASSPANSTALKAVATASDGLAGWTFASTTVDFAGFYELVPALADGMRLAVSGSSMSGGANVQILASDGSLAQRWWIRDAGDGWYTVTPCNSALRLDVEDASSASGANVQQWADNGSTAQKWRFEMGEYGVKVVSALGTVLDLWGAGTAGGTNVDAYADNGTAAQAWRLSSAARPSKIGYNCYLNLSCDQVVLPSYASGWYVMDNMLSYEATRDEVVETFISAAMRYVGTTWVDNCASCPGDSIDCSGLVMEALYACGVSLEDMPGGSFNPYTKYYENHAFANTWRLNNTFTPISVSEVQRGDIIYYNGHVVIYLGNSQILEATSVGRTTLVHTVNIWSLYGMSPLGAARLFT